MLMQDDKTEAPIQEPSQEQQPGQDPDALSWTGSEYIYHEKSKGWFVNLTLLSFLVAGVVYLIFRDLIATFTVLFSGLVFGVFSNRTPKEMNFSVGSSEIIIGDKKYQYGSFKAYAIAQEGAIQTIVLYPMKRFETLKTIYCAPEMLDKIVEIIAQHLPVEDHEPDPIERLMHKVRF